MEVIVLGMCGGIIQQQLTGQMAECDIYGARPYDCRRFQMAGDECRDIFIDNTSPMAHTAVETLNKLAPTLRLLSLLTGIAGYQLRTFK
jgi:hypothetical protein